MELWPHQTRAVAEYSESKSKRICLVAPTGAGKTTIACEIISRAVANGKKCLMMAHRVELIDQAHARLASYGIPAGVIMASDPRLLPAAHVQVASVATLIRRIDSPERIPQADLVIIDECHRSMAASYRALMGHYSDAQIVGLTATPWRSDGQGLGDEFEELIVAAQYDELIEQKLIVAPRVFTMPRQQGLSKLKVRCGDYDIGQLDRLMNDEKITADIVDMWRKHANELQTVLFAVSVKHANSLRDKFMAAGVRSEVVSHDTPSELRKFIIQRWRDKAVRVVCNVGVFTEGFDYPELQCCILARPTKHVGLYMQMSGRVLRSAPGKELAVIMDHAGSFLDHGMPTAVREYKLVITTKETKKSKGEDVSGALICMKCRCVNGENNTHCEQCGEPLSLPKGQGELVESKSIHLVEAIAQVTQCKRCNANITLKTPSGCGRYTRLAKCYRCKTTDWQIDLVAAANATTADKVEEYARLVKITEDKKLQIGWAAHKYREQFGVWPNGVIKAAAQDKLNKREENHDRTLRPVAQ